MRCSKCGKKIKKKSSFCIYCGSKVPPTPVKIKKQIIKTGRKKLKALITIPAFLVLILGILTFLVFGGDRVPEKIRNLKGYSDLTGAVREKLPEQINLPFDLAFELPFDLTFDLPFDLPDPGSLLGDREVPDKEQIMEDLADYKDETGEKAEFDFLEIEKRTTVEAGKKDIVYVITETEDEKEIRSNYYRLLYRRHLIGGWKLDEVEPYNVAGEKNSVAGVDNNTVLNDKAIYTDIASGWEHSNVKVLEHDTDVKAGMDTVVVYMELENEYVSMAGTKEVSYRYNAQSEQWEAVGVSKLSALYIEPVGSVR